MPDKSYVDIFTTLTDEQLETIWSSCAEAGLIPQMTEDHLDKMENMGVALAELLGDADHADVIVACSSVDDHTILEALTQKAVTKIDKSEKDRIKQSKKHIRPNGSSSEPREPKEPKAPRENVDNRIIATVKDNPKRPSSKAFARYAKYEVGMTVKDFVAAAGPEGAADIKYDTAKEFITLVTPEEWAAQQG